MDKKIINKIKQATVSFVLLKDQEIDQQQECPFVIIGSGFCIHKQGIIITCKHVLKAFMNKDVDEIISSIPDEEKKRKFQEIENMESLIPNVMFYVEGKIPDSILTIPVQLEMCTMKMDCDLAIARIPKHKYFNAGYPTIDIESYDTIHEGLELGTCGFPLGNFLGKQVGSITSSLTKGILSTISPSSYASVEDLKYFQLDITATYGNSGGPVFNWGNGNVFGVLQGGFYSDQKGNILQGMAKAEPIYKITNNNEIENILNAKPEDFQK